MGGNNPLVQGMHWPMLVYHITHRSIEYKCLHELNYKVQHNKYRFDNTIVNSGRG